MARTRCFMFSSYGTLGDLHPYLSIGMGLQARGHRVIIATSEAYRSRVQSLGLRFAPVRPDRPAFHADPKLGPYFMDQKKGSERIVRELLMPYIRQSYEDLLLAADEADVLVSHSLSFAARLVAEKRKLHWASTVIAPLSLFSSYDPPVLGPAPALASLRHLGPKFHQFLFKQVRKSVAHWSEPWHQFRRELDLNAAPDPIFEGQHSHQLVLILFPKILSPPQPDWPAHAVQTGFPFFQETTEPEALAFCQKNKPYAVFTLGSSAIWDRRDFYAESARAAQALGLRSLLIGAQESDIPVDLRSPEVLAVPYLSFSESFRRAAVVVHQGGIGTLGFAMASGKPMLVVPYAHDQLDNAQRAARLGVALIARRHGYRAKNITSLLLKITNEQSYSLKSLEVASDIAREQAVENSCQALEALK